MSGTAMHGRSPGSVTRIAGLSRTTCALWFVGTLAAAANACGDVVDAAAWTAEDSAAVLALEQAYVAAWERNDREAVLATLAPDAVLLPGGLEPVRGVDAIEAFWWPPDGPATIVTAYETTVDELGGSGSTAYLRGHGRLSFTWEDTQGDSGQRTSHSVYLMVAREGPEGEWRIANRMWHTLPR